MVLISMIAGHHDLDLDVLDQLSTGGHDVARQAVLSRTGPNGAVVLATCNRYEVYLEVGSSDAAPQTIGLVTDLVALASSLPREQVAAHLHVLTGPQVAEHLFDVAAGLDSMVIGEQEISGQVRRALITAREAGTTSSGLERMFQSASRSARAVATQTGLGAAGRSMVSVALDLAQDRMSSSGAPAWSGARIVLVGTGSYAGASLAALRTRGASDVRVYSPSGRAAAFAEARGIGALEESELAGAVGAADVIVACSGVTGPVLGATRLAEIRGGDGPSGAGPRPLVVVDLALRHDVDPSVADLPGVDLITLATVSDHAPDRHAVPVQDAREIVAVAVDDFVADQRGRELSADVVRARDLALAAFDSRIQAWSTGQVDLDEASRERGVRVRRREARSAVHGPTIRARAAARDGDLAAYEAALEELRRLGTSTPSDGGHPAAASSAY